jgi:predicted metal-dependent phosphoesterase TrpH
MLKFDLHMHTSRYSPDSVSDPYALVRQAIKIGLDGIVITEHDTLWPEDELEELAKISPNLIVLAGVEVTGRGGDMLCYGVNSLKKLGRGTSWSSIIEEVHRLGGAAVAAHPFRWGQPFDDLLKENPQLNGIEMMSKNMDHEMRAGAERIKTQFPRLAGLGNSDSHELDTLGTCYTLFPDGIETIQDIVYAIRNNQTTPCVGPLR